MSIKEWPISERPREKFLSQGPSALSDAELLAIFLRTGIKGQSAVDLSRAMIQKWGSLRNLLLADEQRFSEQPGLGKTKYVQLQAALEMARRHLHESIQQSPVLTNSTAIKNYLLSCLRDRREEVFAGLFLDNTHRLICYEELSRGTLAFAAVYPREVVKRALFHHAAALVLVHNHPGGVSKPTEDDKNLTIHLKQALALIEVRVLDHFIVSDQGVFSFAEEGLL